MIGGYIIFGLLIVFSIALFVLGNGWGWLVAALFFVVCLVSLGRKEPESHMNEIVAIDNQILDVLWQLRENPNSQGLKVRLARLREKQAIFWKRHKYERPDGGRIVKR